MVYYQTHHGVPDNTAWCTDQHTMVYQITQRGVPTNTPWCTSQYSVVCRVIGDGVFSLWRRCRGQDRLTALSAGDMEQADGCLLRLISDFDGLLGGRQLHGTFFLFEEFSGFG